MQSELIQLQPPPGWHEQRLTRQQRGALPSSRVFHRSVGPGIRLWVIVELDRNPPPGWHLAISTLTEFHRAGGGYVPANRRPTLDEVEEAVRLFIPEGVAVGAFWPPAEQRVGTEHPTTWHVRQVFYGVPLPPMRRAQWGENGIRLMAGVSGDGQ